MPHIHNKQHADKCLMAGLLLGLLTLHSCQASADNVQMIPPTPLGSMEACPAGMQEILVYSGTTQGGAQAGMNCVPVRTDAQGNIAASGFVQIGNTSAVCTTTIAGAIRFNSSSKVFEGCNGANWQAIGGNSGVGKLYWDGAWSGDQYWCDAGYHIVGFHYDCGCGCLDNATWFECQAD